jgi:hypothetical protein
MFLLTQFLVEELIYINKNIENILIFTIIIHYMCKKEE